MDEKITIKALEEKPLGSWVLSLQGSDMWANPQNVERLKEVIFSLVQEVMERLSAVCILRAMIVTPDIRGAMAPYLTELGQAEDPVYTPDGIFAGKVLTWGNGVLDNSFGIVFLHHGIAELLLEDNEVGFITVAHELGHLHEGFIFMLENSSKRNPVSTSNWNGISSCFAGCIFSEFFAEATAARYYKSQETIDAQLELTMQMLRGAKERIRVAVLDFRQSNRIDPLWGMTLEELSRLFNQFGRSLGLLYALRQDDETETVDKFFIHIQDCDNFWGSAIKELSAALDRVASDEEFTAKALELLYDPIEEGFFAAGFLIDIDDQGRLRLQVLNR